MDEDTSATNFMIRDELMQMVVHREQEPITPFVERVRALYDEQGISTILVAGSSGAYFHVADRVIQMDCYVPKEVTKEAKEAAAGFGEGVQSLKLTPVSFERVPKKFKTGGRIWAVTACSLTGMWWNFVLWNRLRIRSRSRLWDIC